MKLLLLVLAIFPLMSCRDSKNIKIDSPSVSEQKLPLLDLLELKQLIREKKLTLNLNFERLQDDQYPDDIRIYCVATLINHTDKVLKLETHLFSDYESYQIENKLSGEFIEDFANSSSLLPQVKFFHLEALSESRFQIHYEAFVCFQGVSYEDGSVEYKPNGTFIMSHKIFPDSGMEFNFTKNGSIRQVLEMREQDD